ncbi:MAG: hypothetical protein WHU94_09660 [Thermogemmata sp.]|nr:hypothetical protein [Gemmataceae bacterium]
MKSGFPAAVPHSTGLSGGAAGAALPAARMPLERRVTAAAAVGHLRGPREDADAGNNTTLA